MIIKFEQFLNENKKEEKEKLQRKEEAKYLRPKERKNLNDKQKKCLLAKRKYHGGMNDADLPSNNFISMLSGNTETIKEDN